MTFTALSNALRTEGWPPAPLALPIRGGGTDGSLVVRWSDDLKAVALAFQEEHQMFLASSQCAPADHDCMASILEMEAEKGT